MSRRRNHVPAMGAPDSGYQQMQLLDAHYRTSRFHRVSAAILFAFAGASTTAGVAAISIGAFGSGALMILLGGSLVMGGYTENDIASQLRGQAYRLSSELEKR